MTLREGVDTVNWKRKQQLTLYLKLALEEAMAWRRADCFVSGWMWSVHCWLYCWTNFLNWFSDWRNFRASPSDGYFGWTQELQHLFIWRSRRRRGRGGGVGWGRGETLFTFARMKSHLSVVICCLERDFCLAFLTTEPNPETQLSHSEFVTATFAEYGLPDICFICE
jgi:hypothetical protein